MSGESLQRPVTVTNPQGFHMRPATIFAQMANRFQCSVTVRKGDQKVNGKSLWELLLLGAEQGTELVVEVSGTDAPEALESLAAVIAAVAVDDPPDEPIPPKG